jgi:anti-sigma factor ChrR (cupin superfamily)
MTPNDTQMDVLMRRYAKGANGSTARTEHLDADELNAFTEGALPAATRSRYLSHLADCDDCRTVVSQLVMAGGAGAVAQVPAAESVSKRSWWQSFSALVSAPALRYAASAVVLLAVVGVAFVVWRRTAEQPNSTLIARNEPGAAQPGESASPQAALNSQPDAVAQPTVRGAQTSVQPAPGASLDRNKSESLADAPAAPRAAKDAEPAESTSMIASDRAMKAPARAESTPSYAPPPPADNPRQREQGQQQVQQPRSIAGNVQHGGPRRNDTNEKYKVSDERGGTADLAKGRDEDRTRSGANQPTSTENKQEQDAVQTRTATVAVGSRPGSPRKETSEEVRKSDKPQPDEPASVGGRKFRRQGGVWVDLKFKSSMSITTVSRGSENFAALDSKLRSIAQQLGGEVIVVWKAKAYRIR